MGTFLIISVLAVLYVGVASLLYGLLWYAFHLDVLLWRIFKSRNLVKQAKQAGMVFSHRWKRKYLRYAYTAALPVYLALFMAFGLMVNFTPSMPVGIYRQAATSGLGHGDLVMYNLDNPEFLELAKERGYLPQNGLFSSSLKPLIKEAQGLPGDMLAYDANALLTVNDKVLPHTQYQSADSKGRPMPQTLLKFGEIPNGKALLVSYHDGGFDSRYFGLVDMAKLKTVKPVFTF